MSAAVASSFVGAVPFPPSATEAGRAIRPVPAVLPATSCLPTTARTVALVETDRGVAPIVPGAALRDRDYFPKPRVTRPRVDGPTFSEIVARYCFADDEDDAA